MQDFPRFGLGTFLSNKGLTQEAVRYAVEECGYRHIDAAWVYANEEEIGEALHDLFTRKVIKREEIWITSKLWNNAHHPEDVENQCKETLKKLQLDYLDLYLIHFPFAIEKVPGDNFPKRNGVAPLDRSVSVIDTWKAMENLVKKGLVKRIGVSNFSIELLEKLRFAKGITIQPYTNQVECHLYMQQEALIDYCQKRNIYVTTHTSIGRPSDTKGEPQVLEDEELKRVSNEINRPIVNVAIKFLQSLSPYVVVLVKSVTPSRIKSNIDLDFELTPEQIARLRKCEMCYRYCDYIKVFGLECFGDSY